MNNVKTNPYLAAKNILFLESGREIQVSHGGNEDILEVIEPTGKVSLKVRLTENGPIMLLEGVKLEIKGSNSVSIESKEIAIKAENKATLESNGTLDIQSEDEMNVKSTDEVKVRGKMIHLN